MKKQKILLALLAFVVLSSAIGFVNGQEADPETEENVEFINYALAFATFVVAGVFYSSSGWIKKIRRVLAGENVPLDPNKMGKTVLIGVILGVGAFIYSAYEGDTIVVFTMQDFFVQVAINTTVILLIDKWILGRADTIPPVPTTPTNDIELDELHPSEPEAITTGGDPNNA